MPSAANPPDVLDLTQRLVAVPSESTRSNLPLVDLFSAVLADAGFALRRIEQPYADPGTGPKYNLVAERGHGPRRLVFSGHVDTVPIGDPALWRHDPYGGEGFRDGRLYGRGSVDMKGQVAAMTTAIAAAPEDVLDRLTLVLAITADEEIGHLGIKTLARAHAFEDAIGAIVGEPTDFAVYHAHKGALSVRVEVNGIACHSSQPWRGVNAIEQAIRLIGAMDRESAGWRALRHPAFGDEPPTYTVSQIGAGVADNVVPDRCWFHVNARGLVPEHLDAFLAGIRRTIAALAEEDAARGIPEERRFMAVATPLKEAPSMICGTDTPFYRFVAAFTGQTDPRFARYGTDGGVLSQVGLPCVVWGPGDIGRAHMPNEYIEETELREAVSRYAALIGAAAAAELPTATTRHWERPIRPV